MGTPHDVLFRRAFGRAANARDLLRSALPRSIAQAIVWRSLRLIDGSFVDKRLRRSHTDLLFTAIVGSRRVLLYVLVEHKATDDRFTALQLFGYLHAIWARHHRDHPRARFLPPILPFVLHHGERSMRGPTSLRGLIDLRCLPAELVALQPEVRFVLDDLADQTESQLQDRVSSTFAQLALLSMQILRSAEPATAETTLRGWTTLTERLATAEDGQDDLLALFSYILKIGCLPEPRVGTVSSEITPRSAKTMLTTAQQMSRRITRENGPKWRQQGEARLLLRQLEKKFGPVPKAILTRVRRARSAQLGRWAEQILTASSLDQVFAA